MQRETEVGAKDETAPVGPPHRTLCNRRAAGTGLRRPVHEPFPLGALRGVRQQIGQLRHPRHNQTPVVRPMQQDSRRNAAVQVTRHMKTRLVTDHVDRTLSQQPPVPPDRRQQPPTSEPPCRYADSATTNSKPSVHRQQTTADSSGYLLPRPLASRKREDPGSIQNTFQTNLLCALRTHPRHASALYAQCRQHIIRAARAGAFRLGGHTAPPRSDGLHVR